MTVYANANLRTIAMPIGGIGTGCFSITGNGGLNDWEIFHRPNKQVMLPNTFFSIWTKCADGKTDARVLQTLPDLPLMGDYMGQDFYGFGHGARRENGLGLRHMKRNSFRGEYPFAWVDFEDPSLPVHVEMMAYNPFIPLNVEDSSIPAGIFEFKLTNTQDRPVDITLAANLFNAVGYRGHGLFSYMEHGQYVGSGDRNYNQFVKSDNISALMMASAVFTADKPYGGTMAIATPWQDISYQTAWLRSAWFDSLQAFWDEFSQTGRLTDRTYTEPHEKGKSDTGSLALHARIAPGETVMLPLYITWHFPTFIKYWLDSPEESITDRPMWRVPYASRFEDALDVARYLKENEPRLRQDTAAFHEALFSSTLPPEVLDAVSSQMSTLKTPTVTMLEEGSFYGWEGIHSTAGSCQGSCTHVWNYALTHAYLFPSLERSMRRTMFHYSTDQDGRMAFRLPLPLGKPSWEFHPAADGQMGNVMQVYRDWIYSGDNEWLREMWPKVKLALEYAWRYWDYNIDGVMEGLQHNTYDIEFYGPNSMMQSWYVGALRCATEMASALGDESAGQYASLAQAGAAWMDANLFNGSYYIQQLDVKAVEHSPVSTAISIGGQREGHPKYQYETGCLSDQLIGAWMGQVVGLGELFNPEYTRTTLQSIHRHNFRQSLDDHSNAQRIYALDDEPGLLLCTWPLGDRPDLPFVYSDEVWTGIEYQVASHLIYEGLVEEGLEIVRGVRSRYDGQRRNPWNEMECGSHYARAMASWGVLLALSSFQCDLTRDYIGFNPVNTDFRVFWSTGTGWGNYQQSSDAALLTCVYGEQRVYTWRIGCSARSVTLNDKPIEATFTTNNGLTWITLPRTVVLYPGDTLKAVSP